MLTSPGRITGGRHGSAGTGRPRLRQRLILYTQLKMTTEQFLTYQRFNDRHDATELAGLLDQHQVAYQLEDHSPGFDATFANTGLGKEYRVKLRQADFARADALQLEIANKLIAGVDKDHYLFGFSDEELTEVVLKRDEWSKFDFLLAQKILKDRGREINPDAIAALSRQRLAELAKPEESRTRWIIVGYVLAVLGGLLGVFVGIHLLTHKRTLPNGDRVVAYSAADRQHGRRITILGLVFLVIGTGVRIVQNF